MGNKNRINSLVVIPSLTCDLKCSHCLRESGPDRTERMSQKTLDNVGRLTRQCDYVSDVTISGGEPMLDPQLLTEVLQSIEVEASSLYIATNGLWARDEDKRLAFWRDVLPAGRRIVEGYADLGFTLELSLDQYHRAQADARRGWAELKADRDQRWVTDYSDLVAPDPDDFDDPDDYDEAEQDYYSDLDYAAITIDPEGLTICERPEQMRRVLPLGRARDWPISHGTEYCSFDGNGRDLENQITIWPDGRVSACCDGGAWVGNINRQDYTKILANRRRFLFHLRRECGTYKGERGSSGSGVPTWACRECEALGAEFFGETFENREG